jgi:hypothetical protein
MLIFRNNCYSRISIMPKFGQLDNFTKAAVAARVERLASDLQRQERRRKMWDSQKALRMCLKMVYVYPELPSGNLT